MKSDGSRFSPTNGRFSSKVCIVTGSGSGIGRSTAERLSAEGGKVVIVDLNEEHARATGRSIERGGGEAIALQADVSQSQDVQKAIQTALERWHRLDVVVNNAAKMTFNPVIELGEADWDSVLEVNLRSVFLFSKYSLPHMRWGAIVNVSSVHAHETTANVSPYAASKGGLEAFTRALSREISPSRARINCVAPGAIDTPMLWQNPNIKSGKETVEGAIGKPEDVAASICFLASDEARFIHGTTLVVDGGRLDIL